ncbi:MAG: hypothetical protein M3160_09910 [Candidatus Eremiobacteraeota bacterium]|nr:hypothetical protein [Candidatus Eremiobacteraeota bacterium]
MTALEAFFDRLVDYAGLFPPALLSMGESIDQYEQARSGNYTWILGRFICPASRLPEFHETVRSTVPLSIIIETPHDAREWFDATKTQIESLAPLAPACFEIRLPEPVALRENFDPNIAQLAALLRKAGLAEVPVFVELPRTGRWSELLDSGMRALSRANLRAKIRCGGATRNDFPSSANIADFIAASKEYGVPFKATAGLHHPVRHRDQRSGSAMHGFLNIVGAAVFANSAGFSRERLIAVLDEEDSDAFTFAGEQFTWRSHHAPTSSIAATRRELFTAYGSCSFTEPIADLQSLGILRPHDLPV